MNGKLSLLFGWAAFSLTAVLIGGAFAAEPAGESVPSAQQPTEKTDLLAGLTAIAKESSMPVYSICVIQDGVSRTAYFQPSTRCHNTYSIAKLFCVTAVGILEDRGLIDTEELVYPIFQDRFPEGYDPKWERVKVSDVMTHRIGFGKGALLDIDAQEMTTWQTDDFLKLVFGFPLVYEPGEKRVYTDAAFYLISRIVTEKTGEKLDDFMIRELLAPMEFNEYAFSKCPQGYPMGATGLYISTEDMAKLGGLYANRGVYHGKRLLSERYVDKVIQRGFELAPCGSLGHAYQKGGMNGQMLYVNMVTKTVVAIHSFNGFEEKMMEYVYDQDP